MSIAQRLAGLIEATPTRRLLVAFDGPDAAGKTTLARAVAGHLSRPALCASVDGWHNPRDVRLRRGDQSPEGYYRDSFDYEALVRNLLTPFRAGATQVQTARFDYLQDQVAQTERQVPPDAVLLFDGVFLCRSELLDAWDLRIYLHVPEEVTLSRAAQRDLHLFGDESSVRQRYRRRYLPGQALYRQEAAPLDVADVLLDNTDWRDPVVVRWPEDE